MKAITKYLVLVSASFCFFASFDIMAETFAYVTDGSQIRAGTDPGNPFDVVYTGSDNITAIKVASNGDVYFAAGNRLCRLDSETWDFNKVDDLNGCDISEIAISKNMRRMVCVQDGGSQIYLYTRNKATGSFTRNAKVNMPAFWNTQYPHRVTMGTGTDDDSSYLYFSNFNDVSGQNDIYKLDLAGFMKDGCSSDKVCHYCSLLPDHSLEYIPDDLYCINGSLYVKHEQSLLKYDGSGWIDFMQFHTDDYYMHAINYCFTPSLRNNQITLQGMVFGRTRHCNSIEGVAGDCWTDGMLFTSDNAHFVQDYDRYEVNMMSVSI